MLALSAILAHIASALAFCQQCRAETPYERENWALKDWLSLTLTEPGKWTAARRSRTEISDVQISGAVHKVRHAIFGQFSPSLLSHFVTHPGTPRKYVTHLGTPRFLEGLVQKSRTKAPLYKFCLNCSRGFFIRGFCQGVFCLEGFAQGGFCSFPFCQNTSVTTES